jgi:hypothetical protein
METVEVDELHAVEVHGADVFDAGTCQAFEDQQADASDSDHEDAEAGQVCLGFLAPRVNRPHLRGLDRRHGAELVVESQEETVADDTNTFAPCRGSVPTLSPVPHASAPRLVDAPERQSEQRLAGELVCEVGDRHLRPAVRIGQRLPAAPRRVGV